MSNFFSSDWDAGQVLPKLFVGSLSAAIDTVALQKNNISRVLTAAGRLNVDLPVDVEHFVIDIADHPSQNILPLLEECITFLDPVLLAEGESTENVLVHCASGVSRSVTVCCAWLMVRKCMTLKDALVQVRINRPLAGPNSGFYAQLEALEECAGDFNKADSLFKSRLDTTGSFLDIIFQQRETANKLLEQIDRVEESMKEKMSQSYSTEEREEWISELSQLLLGIKHEDSIGKDSTSSLVGSLGIKDRVSKMIRKDAGNKCRRLLEDLSANLREEQGL